MDKKLEVKEMLEKNHQIFENVAIESLEALFGMEFNIKEPWGISERLKGKFDHIVSLGSGNDSYQSMIAIGISDENLKAIPGLDESMDLLDILGEVANTYTGLLMDHEEITEYFGFLNQSVPQYTNEEMFFPKVWSVDGNVYFGDSEFYFGCAVRPVRTLFPMPNKD